MTTVRLQLFPHTDTALHLQTGRARPFVFSPVEHALVAGAPVRIGRKVDRGRDARPSTREQRAANNVCISSDPAIAGFVSAESANFDVFDQANQGNNGNACSDASANDNKPGVYVAFRSKVVSRAHAELWLGNDGTVYLRDIGSSSGSFLNRLRLSPSGRPSRPHALKSGDVVQLGVDYQGRTEEIYKAVLVKVFLTVKTGECNKVNPVRLKSAMRSLIAAMSPTNPDEENASTDCCICLGAMAPLQALFLAPCSHCFHYKCVTPLLGSGFMFQCPLCRQVANLDASTAMEYEDTSMIVIEKEKHINLAAAQEKEQEEVVVQDEKDEASKENDTSGNHSASTSIPISNVTNSTLVKALAATTISDLSHATLRHKPKINASRANSDAHTTLLDGLSTPTAGNSGPSVSTSSDPVQIPSRNINSASNATSASARIGYASTLLRDDLLAQTPSSQSYSLPARDQALFSTSDSNDEMANNSTDEMAGSNDQLPTLSAAPSTNCQPQDIVPVLGGFFDALSRGDRDAAAAAVQTYTSLVTEMISHINVPNSAVSATPSGPDSRTSAICDGVVDVLANALYKA